MRLFTVASVLVLMFSPIALAQSTVSVIWNSDYDTSSTGMNTTTCATVLDQSYPTFGAVPTFPYLTGASFVTDSNTTGCGTCWSLVSDVGRTTVVVINGAADGFVITEEAANDLTDHHQFLWYTVQANATQLDASVCGL
ncbi:hypothetical protein IEO21_00790 [Rhodonia placenta]|uniref:Uncharacterized protein n=1 Tax=Rhodonia placenta TaxID=104341 RepID=A0A8H7U6Q1_9APHY|nr:hypothetical protein IEO21_00790 [Postia placenta]